MPILRLAGKAPRRRRPVNSALDAMAIRRANSQDASAIAEVQVRSWQRAYSHLLPADWLASMSVEARASKWQEILASEHAVAIASNDGEVVGFVSAGVCRDADRLPGQYEIYALYVLPECWSQGQGSALLQWAIEQASTAQARSISLWAIVGNERAATFYARHGFSVQAGSRQAFELAGLTLHEDRLVLSVAQNGV